MKNWGRRRSVAQGRMRKKPYLADWGLRKMRSFRVKE